MNAYYIFASDHPRIFVPVPSGWWKYRNTAAILSVPSPIAFAYLAGECRRDAEILNGSQAIMRYIETELDLLY